MRHGRRHAIAFVVGVTALAGAALTAPPAFAAHIQCGDTITASTTLDSDLVDCPGPGIRVTGPNVTLDLGGHTVDGTGTGTGVQATACPFGVECEATNSFTLRNGHVRDFRTGVDAFDGPFLVEDLVVTENLVTGLTANHAIGATVRGVLAHDNGAGGINLGFLQDATVVDNEVHSNGSGLGGGTVVGTDIERNSIHGNEFNGLAFTDVRGNRIAHNRIAGSGLYGMFFENGSTANLLLDNRVADSGADGIFFDSESPENALERNRIDGSGDDGIDMDAPGSTLTRNTANHNGDLGIEAVAGTIDGGKNKAAGNGDPVQCQGVSCK
jgi:hypothetical protein